MPENSYRKDINNQLSAFEGTWKGNWNNKIFTIIFKKLTHQYNKSLKIYNDQLVGKFQVKDSNGNILFDNLNISDNDAKIEGGKIFPNGMYSLSYYDKDLCGKMGFLRISFTNSEKTQMQLKFGEISDLIDSDCFFHGKPAEQRPQPIPKDIILIKQ